MAINKNEYELIEADRERDRERGEGEGEGSFNIGRRIKSAAY